MIEVLIPKRQDLDNFDQIYLITEFCDSDLQKVFKSDNIFFEIEDVRFILYQILCGYLLNHIDSNICTLLTWYIGISNLRMFLSMVKVLLLKYVILDWHVLFKNSRHQNQKKKVIRKNKKKWSIPMLIKMQIYRK